MMKHTVMSTVAFLIVTWFPSHMVGQVLDKPSQLAAQTFWDNRDWDWYQEHIPFFDCPDPDIATTYYYRWELLTKHLTYGSPSSGYSFTEFIDRPFWSGAYGAISCPAGHQLYEARWLRNPTIARDYLRYWFRTPGAQPRNYSTWLADAGWAVHQVHPDKDFLMDLLPDLVRNYEGWEARHFVPEVGLFWQTGHDDGMEFNINSRQTKDILRGAPSYRPSFNAYMWADAQAIARLARLANQPVLATQYEQKAEALKRKMLALLWDEKRQFFFPVYKNDEERDGFKIKALTKTYESGQYAGDPHGRELIGYVPWQFNMIEVNSPYDAAWAKLMDRDGFFAAYGPSTVERNDPMFLLQKSCCWWSGQSWPYATSQTLKAMANRLQGGSSTSLKPDDYVRLLQIFAQSHRKDGKPYLAEALHPDTGSFEGHDGYNHSEHYFHSSYCDLVISGLVGVDAQADRLIVNPLAPKEWDYFALDDLPYHGHRISVLWDRTGEKYQRGAGFQLLVDGKSVAKSNSIERLEIATENMSPTPTSSQSSNGSVPAGRTLVNYAVNNEGTYYPRVTASFSSPKSPLSKLNDGNYWYTLHPPNRWTCEGSPNSADTVVIDLGTPRSIHTVKLYLLDDATSDQGDQASKVVTPERIEVEVMVDGDWRPIEAPDLTKPMGHRANVVRFDSLPISQLRVTLHHAPHGRSGLSEIEAWGEATLPIETAPPPSGNLAYNPKRDGFPRATASFTDRFGGQPASAIDGKTVFLPTPMNRWTSYESPTETDWWELDFGKPVEFNQIELAIYDDRGGVQPPDQFVVEHWTEAGWKQVAQSVYSPAKPVGGQWNEVRFETVTSSKLRVVFTHHGKARSGVTEVMVWKH